MTDSNRQNGKPTDAPSDDSTVGSGESLGVLVATRGALPWPLVRWFAVQIADVLGSCHSRGIVHGMVSSETIHLKKPWPCEELAIPAGLQCPGEPINDLDELGRLMNQMLGGDGDLSTIPPRTDPSAVMVLKWLDQRSVGSAEALSECLIESMLETLPDPEVELELQVPVSNVRQPAVREIVPEVPAHPSNRPNQVRNLIPMVVGAVAAMVVAALILKNFIGGDDAPPDGLAGSGTPSASSGTGQDDAGVAEDHDAMLQEARDREAREQAERDRALAEQEAVEKAARDQAVKEQAAKEQAAKELAAKEQAAKDLAARQRAAKELADKERAAEELAEKERAAKQQAAMEQAAREQKERERMLAEAAKRDDETVAQAGNVLEGNTATNEEKERMFAEVLALAGKGHLGAIELCGVAFWKGSGVSEDRSQARVWFEKGARLGGPRSMMGLGLCYEMGIGGAPDLQKAVDWWRKSAEGGNPLAMNRLGNYYNSAAALPAPSYEAALEWWRKAAEKGVAEAMTNIGIYHDIGRCVPKDPGEAVRLWEASSRLGEPLATTLLGLAYFDDKVPGKSQADAFPLFETAAKEGVPAAMTGLGACYIDGIGVPKNREKAIQWLTEASNRGDKKAKDLLEKISASPNR